MSKHRIYIDQSGKIEETGKPTVLAFSNSSNGSLIISAKHKRDVQRIYRERGRAKIYTIQVFSAMIYLLLEKHRISDKPVMIDLEYEGREGLIKTYILQLVRKRRKIKLSPFDLGFIGIGKKVWHTKLPPKVIENREETLLSVKMR